MKIIFAFVFASLLAVQPVKAQQLDSILPVFCQQGGLADSVSFILTASDYNLWRGLPVKYASSVQIIDGAHPWPPRWFATAPIDTNMRRNNIKPIPVINAFGRDGEIVLTNAIFRHYPGGHDGMNEAVLICNRQLELIDTFYKPGQEVDSHDFAINDRSEKLYFLVCDTMVHTSFFGTATDTLVEITYEKIQIDNKEGKTIFSWSPIEKFGLDAVYVPYLYEKSVINTRLNVGWSHGNSLCWDKDGNILYSYKYIGIGKISVNDGHFIWHVSRNKQKAGPASDTLPIFLQHDLSFVKDESAKSTYTVLSNGDSLHPFCSAYMFTVTENSDDPKFKIVKRFTSTSVPQTGGGNYDVDASGDYLINYGIYKGDTIVNHILFECRKKDDSLLAQYTVLPQSFCYRVHRLTGQIPARPEVAIKNGILSAKKQMHSITWYELSGPGLKVVTRAGAGKTFKPRHKGFYCLVAKYGVGYVVSRVIEYANQ